MKRWRGLAPIASSGAGKGRSFAFGSKTDLDEAANCFWAANFMSLGPGIDFSGDIKGEAHGAYWIYSIRAAWSSSRFFVCYN